MSGISVSAAMRVRNGGSRVAHFVTKGGRAYTLSLTSETASLAGLAYGVAEVPRPGLQPLIRLDAPASRTLAFENTMTLTATKNLVAAVNSLIKLARNGYEVRLVGVSDVEAGIWWRIKDLGVTITERTSGQQPKTMQMSWSLIESFNRVAKIGKTPPPGGMFKADLAPISPASGAAGEAGTSTTPSQASNQPGGSTYDSQVPSAAGSSGVAPNDSTYNSQVPYAANHYRTKSGDTLWSISALLWGNGYLWAYLANANDGKQGRPKLKYDYRVFHDYPGQTQPNAQGSSNQGDRYLVAGQSLNVPKVPGITGADPHQPGATSFGGTF